MPWPRFGGRAGFDSPATDYRSIPIGSSKGEKVETRLVFQTTDTDTCEEITDESYVIDVAAISADDAAVLDTCDHYGVLSDQGRAIVRTIGIPMSELWAAYKWRESLTAAGILAGVEQYVQQLIEDSDSAAYDRYRTVD